MPSVGKVISTNSPTHTRTHLLLFVLGAERIILWIFFTSSTWWDILSMRPRTSSTYQRPALYQHSQSNTHTHTHRHPHTHKPVNVQATYEAHPSEEALHEAIGTVQWDGVILLHLCPTLCGQKINGVSLIFRSIPALSFQTLTAASSASRSFITAIRSPPVQVTLVKHPLDHPGGPRVYNEHHVKQRSIHKYKQAGLIYYSTR